MPNHNSTEVLDNYYFIPIKTKFPENLFHQTVLFFDIDNIIANQLINAGLDVKLKDAFASDKEEVKYMALLCKVPRRQREKFAKLMAQTPTEMLMHGHTDYAAFFKEVLADLLASRNKK